MDISKIRSRFRILEPIAPVAKPGRLDTWAHQAEERLEAFPDGRSH